MALTIEFSITVCLTPCDFHVKKNKNIELLVLPWRITYLYSAVCSVQDA